MFGNASSWELAEKAAMDALKQKHASEALVTKATDAVNKTDGQLSELDSTMSTLDTFSPILTEVKQGVDRLRTQNTNVANHALETAGYLGKLAAKGETIQLSFTAKEYAQRILDLQQAMDLKRPEGLLWDRPEELDKTLETIASSKVEPSKIDLGDLM
jgi:hypothetical protein